MPPVLEPPQASAPAQDRPTSFMHRLAVSVLRLVVILAIAAFLGGGWYLSKKGFGRHWRNQITQELRKRGVEAHIRRLTLDPFRGLVAQDVRIFDYKNRDNTIAVISQISLDINYAALLHKQPFLNALEIRNAQVTLPIKNPKGQSAKPQLTNLRAHIYFPPEQIYVSQAEGNFCGVRVSATGQLIKRDDYRPSPALSEEEWQKRLSILQRVVEELRQFSYARSRPSLQIKFSGDLAQLENAHVEGTLRGEQLRRPNYEMRDLFVAGEWSEQRLTMTRCEWKDSAGVFSAHATWERKNGAAGFEARSSIDLKSFLQTLKIKEQVDDLTFDTPPQIELSGSANLAGEDPRLKVVGHVDIGKFSYRTIPFTDLSGDFSWDGDRTFLHDVRVRSQGGQLTAELLDGPDDFRLNLDSTINPSVIGALASPDMRKFLNEWEWERSPAIYLAIRGPDRQPANWRGDGTMALGRTRFRGIWMNTARADIHFGDGAVTYNNFKVTRDEGVGTGTFTYDFAKHEVRIANVKSSLRPADAIFWIEPDQWKNVVPYKFQQTPNVTANGVYQFRGGKNTHLEIGVDAAGGMDYVFLGKTLPFSRVSAKLIFTNDRLQIVDLAGGLLSGTVQGGADISLAHNDPHYQARIAVNGIDFPQLTNLYYQYKSAEGQLSGKYDFKGMGDNARRMNGSGKVEVTNGNVFAIPVFGPISEILNTFLPGSGYSIARKANGSFTIKDGIIHTEDFEAAGKLFSMLGRGDIHFLDDKLDFELRLNAHGPGLLLTPMYKLFEYTGEGSLKKPNWHPKRF